VGAAAAAVAGHAVGGVVGIGGGGFGAVMTDVST